MYKAFCTRQAPQEIVDYLKENNVDLTCWTEQRNLTNDEVLTKLNEGAYDGFLAIGFAKMDKNFFENTKLSVACTYSVGYDHIDIPAATQAKVPIGNTPDVLSKATADSAFLLMMMAARRALLHYNRIVQNNWNSFSNPLDNCGYDLQGKTIGIFGLGRIGLEMAKACRGAFNMKVIYHNRKPNKEMEELLDAKYVSFEDLLAQSDVISLHSNLNPENENKFNYEAFSKMKKNAIIVNTARGKMINEDDLCKAIDEKLIFAAGLDVFVVEPMAPNHPFLSRADICCLPHIGSATIETRNEMWKLCADNLIAGLQKKPLPACVNPEVYQ